MRNVLLTAAFNISTPSRGKYTTSGLFPLVISSSRPAETWSPFCSGFLARRSLREEETYCRVSSCERGLRTNGAADASQKASPSLGVRCYMQGCNVWPTGKPGAEVWQRFYAERCSFPCDSSRLRFLPWCNSRAFHLMHGLLPP